jgi:peptide/nickel transport system substrate-binding protein
MHRRRVVQAAALFAVLCLMTGSLDARPIRWARSQDALTLDPYGQNEGPTHNLMHLLYEPLVDRDVKSGSLLPTLALAGDGRSYHLGVQTSPQCHLPQRRSVQRR